MKHLTRIAALMVAATIFALPLGAQHRGGHSSGHSGASSSYSGGSRSSGSSHSGVSRSSGSSGSSHRSSSYSRSSDSGRSSGSSRSSGSVSTRSSSERSSGSVKSSSGSSVRERSSSRSSASRSSAHVDSKPSGSSRPSGSVRSSSGGARAHSGVRPNSGSSSHKPEGVRPHTEGTRPNVGGARSNHYSDGVYSGRRPAPGSRPYASGGAYHGKPAPAPRHVHVNPRPGHHSRPAFVARELRHSPAHFSHHGYHSYGHYRHALPPRYVVRHYWGRDYYYYNDIWYRYYAGRYWVCRPPFGYVFTPLADALYTACTFAYYFDRLHYYDTVNENANTIVAQNETIAANNAVIASQNETIARNAALAQASGDLANSLGLVQSFASADTEYFYNDGVFYVKGTDGQYTVIVPPAGALVETLPEDFEQIELGGNTYYKVDDTVYRATVSPEGKACFEVLGQFTN